MTNFAVVIWSYQQQGSALTTALLAICSYAPYVLLSIFAGALSDRWNKKITMLVSDSFAALCTIVVLILLSTGHLEVWHLYLINTLNGLMNTIQQPASDVATSLLTPQKHYQRVSGMRSFSQSLVTVLTPVLATALLSFTSLQFVILFDLITFAVAFVVLLLFVKIPNPSENTDRKQETLFQSVKSGLHYLRDNRGISLGAVLGWIVIPLMSANMDALFRTKIPIEMQGRVYSARNTLQFFTIPLGYLCGGILVDKVFEPFMSAQSAGSLWVSLFGSEKGSGAAMLFFVIGIIGALSCLPFRADKHIWKLEE